MRASRHGYTHFEIKEEKCEEGYKKRRERGRERGRGRDREAQEPLIIKCQKENENPSIEKEKYSM